LKKLREKRDKAKVEESLASLEKVCETDENLMPFILDCVRSYATLGEICTRMKNVFGEYKAREVF